MLALFAGQGRLPVVLLHHLNASDQTPFVAELAGFPSEISDFPTHSFRVEHLGSLLSTLKDQGVNEVCFAGAIGRPKLDPSAIDAATMPLVPRMMAALSTGDDGALRAVLDIFEEAGFTIRAAHEILPDLLPKAGIYGATKPTERDETDAKRATQIIAAMGEVDVGQACVVAAGQALAIETLGGTDWMLSTLAGDKRPNGPPGGILAKAAKPGQDRRVDLPTIGPDTISRAADAGLSGVVIEHQSVMVLDFEQTLSDATARNMFLWVREPAG